MTSGDLGVVVAWLLTYAAHSTVLLGGAWLLTRNRVQSPNARDIIWKVALVGGLVSASMQQVIAREPLAGRFEIGQAETWDRDGQTDGRTVREPIVAANASADVTESFTLPSVSPSVRPPVAASTWTLSSLPWSAILFWTWLVVASTLAVHFLLRWFGLSARFGRREPVEDVNVLALVERLRHEAGVRRVIRVTQAPSLASPVALGFSEICLPEAALDDLDADQQSSMLAHEVAHIARRDPLWLMASCLLERVFFFQPLNHLARRRLQESAEYLCDDWAARRSGSGLTLAKCLVRVAEWIDTTPYPVPVSGMAETRSQFVSRIHRLIANHGLKNEPRRRWLLPFSVAMVGVVVAAAPGAKAGRMSGWADERMSDSVESTTFTAEARENSSMAVSTIERTAKSEKVSLELKKAYPLIRPSESGVPVPQDTGIVVALLAALKDPDVEVRRAAAQSLGNLQSARAVPGLIAALKDEDIEVRMNVLEALGNLRDQRAFDGIVEALKDPSPKIRAHAAEAVRDLIGSSGGRAVAGRALAQLTTLLSDSSLEVRRQAIESLKDYDGPNRPVDAYLTALKDPDKEVRAAAADALGQAEDARAVQPLILALQDKVADVRHEAAHALGHLHDRRASDALGAAIKDANNDVRAAAIEALGELELTEAPAALISALNDENRDVRHSAANALGQIHDPKAVPGLVQLLKDTDPDVREQAVDALSEIRDNAAINALVAAMQSADPNVRKRAAQALGERR